MIALFMYGYFNVEIDNWNLYFFDGIGICNWCGTGIDIM